MKLIIDIFEEDYESAKQRWARGDSVHKMDYCVSKGIPLDDVKAEIKKNIIDEPVENGTNAEMACYNGGLLKGLEILDNIGKEESEVHTQNE